MSKESKMAYVTLLPEEEITEKSANRANLKRLGETELIYLFASEFTSPSMKDLAWNEMQKRMRKKNREEYYLKAHDFREKWHTPTVQLLRQHE